MKNLKVLVISQHFWPENFRFNDLIFSLSKEIDITVLTAIPNYPEGNFYENYRLFDPLKQKEGGVGILRAPIIPRKKNKIFLALNYASFPLSAIFRYFLGSKKNHDAILVCQTSPIFMAIPAIIISKIKKIPCYLWVTDLWPESLRATNTINNKFIMWGVEQVVKWVYRNSTEILISCKGFESSIKNKVKNSKITYFPYWAEDFYLKNKEFKEIPLEVSDCYLKSNFNFTFAGNIGEAQDFDTLVQAVKILNDKGFTNFKFNIIGDGRAKEKFLTKINTYKLNSFFNFVCRKPPEMMPLFFSLTDVLFLSLRKDPIFEITVPSKLQSYMAAGKPILCAIDGEASEIIKDANCGLICPAQDPKKLAEKIIEFILLSSDALEEMGKGSKDYYKKHFNRDDAFRKMKEILTRNINKNKFKYPDSTASLVP